jgi:purine-nucleoside phosphorylase
MTVDLATQISEAADAIHAVWGKVPRAGIILGTGAGRFARHIAAEAEIPYAAIPHFPRATALGHRGQLVCGTVDGLPIVAMDGRFHLYEGYTAAQITLPVRVLKRLGIELLIATNASGGLQPHFRPGDLLVIEDHINLMGANPLIGPNDDSLGPRFPDLSRPYDPQLIEHALAIAREAGFAAHRGVYVAVTGPNYETRAEYRFLRIIGGDVVGMSTVPEVLVAAHMGLRVLALSTITNVAGDGAAQPTDGHQVLAVAASAEERIGRIIRDILAAEARRQLAVPEGKPTT